MKLVHQHNTKFMKKTIYLLILILAVSSLAVKRADAQVFSVGVSIHVGPPVIPVYTQPVCPVDGYLWVPGYWAYDDDYGYYWVPGYWAEPPQVGFLWTPGYWGYAGGVYGWNAGYWGPHIGFYGGVNYGCGYYGSGFAGGNWVGGHFRYNTAVVNVNTAIVHNTYVDRTVINNTTVNRVSYNGGPGGVTARPSPAEESAAHEQHVQATATQMSQQHNASIDRNQFASVNHGRPANLAVARPTAYHPANTTASLSRATASNRPNNAPSHNVAPAATHAPAVNHTPVTHNPAPVTHNPAPVVHHKATPPAANHTAAPPVHHNPAPVSHPQSQVHRAAPRPAPHPAPRPAPAPREPAHHRR
jgi:hypothetical protein